VRVVVDHPIAGGNLRSDEGDDLLAGRRAVRAGADDDREAIRGHVGELGEEPRQQSVARERPRLVRNDDGHPVARPNDVGERRGLDRSSNRVAEGGRFVGKAGQVPGQNDVHLARQVDLEARRAVLKGDSHRMVPSSRSGLLAKGFRLRNGLQSVFGLRSSRPGNCHSSLVTGNW
jgi:hypothetical protein